MLRDPKKKKNPFATRQRSWQRTEGTIHLLRKNDHVLRRVSDREILSQTFRSPSSLSPRYHPQWTEGPPILAGCQSQVEPWPKSSRIDGDQVRPTEKVLDPLLSDGLAHLQADADTEKKEKPPWSERNVRTEKI